MPLTRPDGLRTVGPRTMIQAEGQGRLTELTINGNRAEVRVLREGLTAATGVTLVGNTAFVLVDRAKGVAVPYQAGGTREEHWEQPWSDTEPCCVSASPSWRSTR